MKFTGRCSDVIVINVINESEFVWMYDDWKFVSYFNVPGNVIVIKIFYAIICYILFSLIARK